MNIFPIIGVECSKKKEKQKLFGSSALTCFNLFGEHGLLYGRKMLSSDYMGHHFESGSNQRSY
jgi:hypothetical protein